MIRIRMAFPGIVLLCTLSVSSAGQTFVETPGSPVIPRAVQSQAQTPAQSPAESSVIVVKPGLTEEQLADLYMRSEEHTSELQSRLHLVCRLLLEKKKKDTQNDYDNKKSYRL